MTNAVPGNRILRYSAVLVLALISAELLRLFAHFAARASSCTRGEDCMGPFVGYFVLGIPAFAAAFVLLSLGTWFIFPGLVRRWTVVGSAVAAGMGVSILTFVLWQK